MSILRPKLLGWGGAAFVYKFTEHIAVKRACLGETEKNRRECDIYDLLESRPICPNIVRSFYRIPAGIFLQYLEGGTLNQRLRNRQTRDPANNLVTKVECIEPDSLIWRWMAELTDAIAWLECLGYAHGDIRPPNLMLDGDEHLKVTDFDHTALLGSIFFSTSPPYAKILGDGATSSRWEFGNLSPQTEQFAIGSVFYYITRGYEPYDDVWLGPQHVPAVMHLLRTMKFPETTDSKADTVIRKCWHGEYESIQNLSLDVMQLCRDVEFRTAQVMPPEEYEVRKQECMKIVEDGSLIRAPTGSYGSFRYRIFRHILDY